MEEPIQGQVVPAYQDPHALLSMDEVTSRLEAHRQFVQSQLQKDRDFGMVRGVDKPFLWKSGAEKLLMLHQCLPKFEEVDRVEDRSQQPPYFEFTYRCNVVNVRTGEVVCNAEATCSNREGAFYDRWKNEPKGDPWAHRNRVMKMAQKRAMVAAALHVGALSADFTQDEEIMEAEVKQQAPQPAFRPPSPAAPAPAPAPTPMAPAAAPRPANGSATEKQIRAMWAMAKRAGFTPDQLYQHASARVGREVADLSHLSKREASDMIDFLKES
jgi:hypothetical protein